MLNTRREAENCAGSLPKTEVGVLVVIEVFYYAFEMWKACHTATNMSSPKAFLARCEEEPGNMKPVYSKRLLRRAQRSLARAANQAKVILSEDEVRDWTQHGLEHVANAPDINVAACMAEPPSTGLPDDE